jgi:hypothetical protein
VLGAFDKVWSKGEAMRLDSVMMLSYACERLVDPRSLPITGFQSSPAPACPTKASASRL